MTDLPPCIITLPPLPPFPGGGGGGGTSTVTTRLTGEGLGDLIYLSSNAKGVAICVGAYSSPSTCKWYAINTGLTGNALKVRWMNFDPFTASPNGFSRMFIMTDDGLYRTDGLPSAPSWTRVLSLADAQTLTGHASNLTLCWRFGLSARLQNIIIVGAEWLSGGNSYLYVIYSLDGGATWQCDTSKWIQQNYIAYQRYFFDASPHLDDVYRIFAKDSIFYGDPGHPVYGTPNVVVMRSPGAYGGVFPTFSPGLAAKQLADSNNGVRFYEPYCDATGKVYADDNRLYLHDIGGIFGVLIGTQAIRRVTNAFNPLWSSGYTIPIQTDAGDAGMGGIDFLFTNTLNENNACAIDMTSYDVWFSSNLASTVPTWAQYHNPTGGTSFLRPTYMFNAPADSKVWFFCGLYNSGAGAGCVLMTKNAGASATFTDVSKQGQPDGIDAVLGSVNGTDFEGALVLVDYKSALYAPLSVTGTGIDVSHWQGTMNWATAKVAGVTFAFIKATQGTATTDSQFATNWSSAGAQTIQRGAYHYFTNADDPTTQANHFVAVATSAGELGYVVDCEDESATLDPNNLKTFLDRVETLTGQKCIIYTRASWWNAYVGWQSWASDYPLWVADWSHPVPTLPSGWTIWNYWQYSSRGNGATYGAQSMFIDLNKTPG